ncbi:hypothetical protein F511_03922 [Dorcoceras hygrometricum]|uniref:Uncharacterized protein n=1 Tax=Dorcoceras hygrometricum TaxID=472368 RepID=A0A2Z7D5W9_9LAMI|nr:hypothetical protein F511_03922 [Dorcoceras hygrometricum]
MLLDALTMIRWALSVIPRGSWGDVARRSYHDPMAGGRDPDPQQKSLPAATPLTSCD